MPYCGIVAKPVSKSTRQRKGVPPWLFVVLFLASVDILWVLPHQLAPHRIAVDFEPAAASKKP